jgi:hypothetical protein
MIAGFVHVSLISGKEGRGREGKGIQEGEGRYDANPSFLFQLVIRATGEIGFTPAGNSPQCLGPPA